MIIESRHVYGAIVVSCAWWLWGPVVAVLTIAAVRYVAEEVWR